MEGIDSWINGLKVANSSVNKELKNLVDRTSNKLLRKVIMRTPVGKVRGGTLRRSWKNTPVTELERRISNNVEYGSYIEEGHRVVKNGKVVGFAEGRYMLKRSVEEIESSLGRELELAMNNILKNR